MAAVRAIGSKQFVLGFRAADCEVFECENPSEVLGHLAPGVCIVEKRLADAIEGELGKINAADPNISVVIYGSDRVFRAIEMATGMSMR
ncbi:MAG: hypothetical protein NT157_04705 [Candidatus Micrarchaeota archaeon]|nr:hypothetical protein [Candidatus Micrarchaeota archaeon]